MAINRDTPILAFKLATDYTDFIHGFFLNLPHALWYATGSGMILVDALDSAETIDEPSSEITFERNRRYAASFASRRKTRPRAGAANWNARLCVEGQ